MKAFKVWVLGRGYEVEGFAVEGSTVESRDLDASGESTMSQNVKAI